MKFTFRQIAIGDTFDFIGGEYNSYFDRCIKISERKYRSLDTGYIMQIGSINCEIYHIIKGA